MGFTFEQTFIGLCYRSRSFAPLGHGVVANVGADKGAGCAAEGSGAELGHPAHPCPVTLRN